MDDLGEWFGELGEEDVPSSKLESASGSEGLDTLFLSFRFRDKADSETTVIKFVLANADVAPSISKSVKDDVSRLPPNKDNC